MSAAREAWRAFLALDTKYDRRIFYALLFAGVVVGARWAHG